MQNAGEEKEEKMTLRIKGEGCIVLWNQNPQRSPFKKGKEGLTGVRGGEEGTSCR